MLSDLRAVLEQLTDETNDQPIELINDRGEKASFAPMALIPLEVPSEKFEDETVVHHFALLQPLDEKGEETGERLIFDFIENESGELSVELVDNPYVMHNVMELYRQRSKYYENEDEDIEECESIFGGTLTETENASEQTDDASDESDSEKELREIVAPSKAQKKKKGLFGKLFGKK